jgi:hypothetical protein
MWDTSGVSTALPLRALLLALSALATAPALADDPIVLLEDQRSLYVAFDEFFPSGPFLPFDVTHTREGFDGQLTSSFQGTDFQASGFASGGPVEPAADPEVYSTLAFRFRVDSPTAYKLEGSLDRSASPWSTARVAVYKQPSNLPVWARGAGFALNRTFEATVPLTPGTYRLIAGADVGNVNTQSSFSITGKLRRFPNQLPIAAPVGVALAAMLLASGAWSSRRAPGSRNPA